MGLSWTEPEYKRYCENRSRHNRAEGSQAERSSERLRIIVSPVCF